MSRKIKLDEEEINSLVGNFENLLRTQSFQEGKVNYQFNFKDINEKANLFFTCEAWFKIQSLVRDFSGEVQWSGVVEHVDRYSWLVTDILVFPHEVTSATVTSDQVKYEEWINSLDDDTFNHLRFHGHSHVNFSVSPSSLDMQVRQNVVGQISPRDDEAYYIFIIINKKNEVSGEIYDVKNNMLFGTSDINIQVLINNNLTLDAFLSNAHTLAVEPPKPSSVVNNKKDKKNKSNYNDSYRYNYPIGFNDSPYDDSDIFGYENRKY